MSSVLVVTVLALIGALAVLAVVLGALALTRGRSRPRRRPDADGVPADLDALRAEVRALRMEAARALRHLAVVRYDAFADMGGHLSWSLALLDDAGDGVVLTSIHGRSDARSYAKNVAGWRCDQALSPEEEGAIAAAHAVGIGTSE